MTLYNRDNAKMQQRLLIYFRVTGDMPIKLRKEHCLQQTRLQNATAENCLIFYKMRASQQGGQQAWMLTIFHTQVLDLGVILQFCPAPGHKLMKTLPIGEDG